MAAGGNHEHVALTLYQCGTLQVRASQGFFAGIVDRGLCWWGVRGDCEHEAPTLYRCGTLQVGAG